MLQLVPFQTSSSASSLEPVQLCPAAVQAVAAGHDTPWSSEIGLLEGLTVVWIDQGGGGSPAMAAADPAALMSDVVAPAGVAPRTRPAVPSKTAKPPRQEVVRGSRRRGNRKIACIW
jgi:hypothetical protein